MGPFFSLLHSIGLGAWVVERLWLALMLALAVWGILRLLDALIGRPRGVAHIVAGAFYMVNPYIVVFTARTTITLLGYAALPWLLLITLHGVRADPIAVARVARLVVGRGVCADPDVDRWGRQRRGGRLDAGRTPGAAALRTDDRRRTLA